MRIGVATPIIRNFSGGAQEFWKLTSGLRKLGHDVTLFRPGSDPACSSLFLPADLPRRPLHEIWRTRLDAVFFGHPDQRELRFHSARKFWLVMGLNPPDLPMVTDPEVVKICCASWLANACIQRAPSSRIYALPGGVDLEEFFFQPNPSGHVGVRLRDGTFFRETPVPEPPFPVVPMRGVPPDRRAAFYHHCRAFLVHDMPLAGWCNPVAEAMAAGVPVLANFVPCVDDLLPNSSVGYRYRDFQDAARKLQTWAENPGEALRIAQAAREWVSQFSWDRWVAGVDAVLRKEVGS